MTLSRSERLALAAKYRPDHDRASYCGLNPSETRVWKARDKARQLRVLSRLERMKAARPRAAPRRESGAVHVARMRAEFSRYRRRDNGSK